jgi:hypothetical protein
MELVQRLCHELFEGRYPSPYVFPMYVEARRCGHLEHTELAAGQHAGRVSHEIMTSIFSLATYIACSDDGWWHTTAEA